MASHLYVKSIIWLVSFGGLGYGLMRLTEPSEEKLARIRSTTSETHLTSDEKNKLLFMRRLKEAASDPTPIYMKKRTE